jgi:hypothetical protein
MSEDAYGVEPPNPSRPEPPRWEPDDVDYDSGPEPPYPPTVTTAGVIWIVYGCLMLLYSAASLILTFAYQAVNAKGQASGAEYAAGGLCGLTVIALFAAAFLFVGVQSVRGTANDTLGNGIGSILFAGLYFGGAAVMIALGQVIPVAAPLLGGVLLLAAGVLALVGRGPYRQWRYAQRAQQQREAAERKARRRFRG